MDTINTERIVMARESRGINQGEMANRLGMPAGTLSKLEAAAIAMQPELVQRIADITNYPKAFFYQPGEALPDMLSWRKREVVTQKVLSPIQATVNILRLQVQEITRALGIAVPKLPLMDLSKGFTEASAAKRLRKLWKLGEEPIEDLTKVVEGHGIPVIYFDFKTDRVDSRAIQTDDGYPLICINSGQPGDRQRFSLAYQLGHVLLHLYNPITDVERRPSHEANLFAAALLMPEGPLMEVYQKGVTLQVLEALKPKWKVSMISLLYRAADLGQLSENQKRYLVGLFNAQQYRKREPKELDVKPEKGELVRKWLRELAKREGLDVVGLAARVFMNVDELGMRYGDLKI